MTTRGGVLQNDDSSRPKSWYFHRMVMLHYVLDVFVGKDEIREDGKSVRINLFVTRKKSVSNDCKVLII